jgi:hypothetical protein
MVGFAVILIFWLFGSLAVIAGGFWLCVRWGTPKPEKPEPAPAPPVVKAARTSTPPAGPTYLRRWNLQRRWWVVSEKAQWERDFDRLLT